jgi:hypothetical protein
MHLSLLLKAIITIIAIKNCLFFGILLQFPKTYTMISFAFLALLTCCVITVRNYFEWKPNITAVVCGLFSGLGGSGSIKNMKRRCENAK